MSERSGFSKYVVGPIAWLVRPGFFKQFANPFLDVKEMSGYAVEKIKKEEEAKKKDDEIIEAAINKAASYNGSQKFEAWIYWQDVSEHQLAKNLKYSVYGSNIFYILSVFLCFYSIGVYRGVFRSIHSFIEIIPLSDGMMIFCSIVFSMTCFLRGMILRHQSWCMEHRELIPFKEWIKKPSRVLPKLI